MNDYYAGYDEKYPDLIIKVLEYFDISNNADLPVAKKSVIGFCEKYQERKEKVLLSSISLILLIEYADDYVNVTR